MNVKNKLVYSEDIRKEQYKYREGIYSNTCRETLKNYNSSRY